MEIIENANVKSVSMVKLGNTYYALKDEDAVRKSQLWDPQKALTGEMLRGYYQPSFYPSFQAAVTAINNQTVDAGGAEGSENVAVYTDESGKTVIVLLTEVTEQAVVEIQKDVILRLNGKTLSFTASGSKLVFQNAEAKAVVDGRVPGSKIGKEISVESSVSEVLVESFAADCKLLGGSYTISLFKGTKTNGVLAPRGGMCYAEGCVFSAIQRGGSGSMYGALTMGPLVLKNCDLSCENTDGTAYALRSNPGATTTLEIEGCTLRGYSSHHTAVSLGINGAEASVHNSVLLAESGAVSRVAGDYQALALYQQGGELTVIGCKLLAKAANCLAKGLHNVAGKVTQMTDTVCFADSTSGETDTKHSVGIYNDGSLTLKNCSAYGTHSGMQLRPNSQTQVTGGVFEGVCHGGIYFSHKGGSAFVQDATICNARYRGAFKHCFDYDSSLYHSAGLYFGNIGGTVVQDTAAYLDNCRILGGSGNAIVLRDTGGEQNNALYLSNCEVTGGDIRIDDDSHKLYIGKSCQVVPVSNRPGCVVATNAVYAEIPALVNQAES